MEHSHRQRKFSGSLSPSQVARESDWEHDDAAESPRVGLSVISTRIGTPFVPNRTDPGGGVSKQVKNHGSSVVPPSASNPSQLQKFRCYVPGCAVARKKKWNLSTHFKTAHVGIRWSVKLVEDPLVSPPAAEQPEALKLTSATGNYPDRPASPEAPPPWTKIFSGHTTSSAGNGSIHNVDNQTRQFAHRSHLFVKDPFIQRHINGAQFKRRRLDPEPKSFVPSPPSKVQT